MEHTQLPTLAQPSAAGQGYLAQQSSQEAVGQLAETISILSGETAGATRRNTPLENVAKAFTITPRDPSHDYAKLSDLIGQHRAAEFRLQTVAEMAKALDSSPSIAVRLVLDAGMTGYSVDIPAQVAMRILTDAQHEARHQADSYAVKLGIAQQSIP